MAKADPYSFGETNVDYVPTMTAWETNSGSAGKGQAGLSREQMTLRERFFMWLQNRNNPWNPWKRLPVNEADNSEFSSSIPVTISVPNTIAGAALELQSIPMDQDLPTDLPTWDQTQQEDLGAVMQFSGNIDFATAPSSVPVETRSSTGDLSVPDSARPATKLEFSSAESGLRSDSSHDIGNLTATGDLGGIPGPIPQIASPEPSVTALLGLSALVFAARRKARSNKR